MVSINLPHQFTPRPYQKEALQAMDDYKRVCLIWHRRAGKDKTAFQAFLKKALERKGVYYYIFPEYEQGRKAFWDNIDNDGLTMLEHVPKQLIKKKNDQSMQLYLANGSLIQIIGTDRKVDNIVGTNPMGLLFSEFPISDPRGWDLLRPIIKLNGGFAWFVFTPRGKNHGWLLREVARKNPEWYLSELGASDTLDNNGHRIVSDKMIDEERRDGMDEDLIQQEYFVSFEASVKGAYYADQIRDARGQGRIGKVPHEPSLEVFTHWDLGINDTTAIWFWQLHGKEVRLIDHYEMSGEGLEHYVRIIKDKEYKYDRHFLPHDIEVRELQTGNTRKQFLESVGLTNIEVVEKLGIDEGIDMVRRMFKHVWADEDKCERGVNALSSYHKEYDAKNQTYRNRPKHDWASNSADAMRYLAVSYLKMTQTSDFDIDSFTEMELNSDNAVYNDIGL